MAASDAPLHPRPPPVPVLETARLRLRAHEKEDLEPCLAMWSDAAVTRYIGGKPSTGTEVWARILRYAGHWALLGYGYWLVERHDGAYVGDVGLADFARETSPPLVVPEAGWALAPAMQGRGYATEALAAVLAWADARWSASSCVIHPDNAASLRVAAKVGFREVRRAHVGGEPSVVLERQATS